MQKGVISLFLIFFLSIAFVSAQLFIRGDANQDFNVDLSDVQFIANYLYQGGQVPECPDAADSNDDGRIDISDIKALTNNLFFGNFQIPRPNPLLGRDPTPDSLTCADGKGAGGNFYIRIQNLPSNICVDPDELIDLEVRARMPLTSDGVLECVSLFGSPFRVKLRLLESDLLSSDDIIDEIDLTLENRCSEIDEFYLFASHTFRNVNLGDYFAALTKDFDTIELYAEAIPLDELSIGISGDSSDVSSLSCQCVTGNCCDTSRRPYTLKPVNSQPTNTNDEYVCIGIQSPTSTQEIRQRDYFCNGVSANSQTRETLRDTCGLCEFCINGDTQCRNYNGDTCSSIDCDYLDTECRNYQDVSGTCSQGMCIQNQCNIFTNIPQGTHCNSERGRCDSGTCVNCQDRATTICFNSDEYYARLCGTIIERQELKQDCGESSCSSVWTATCEGDNLVERRTCTDRGCLNNACYSTNYQEERFVQVCQFGCSNNRCNPNPNIECSSDADCPSTRSNPFCSAGDVRQTETRYTCRNPGTTSSNCEEISNRDIVVEDCQCDCSNAQCTSCNQCTNECSLGQTRCLDSRTQQTCNNFDQDQCAEWGGNQNCPGGCLSNICSTIQSDLELTRIILQHPQQEPIRRGESLTIGFTITNKGTATLNNINWLLQFSADNRDVTNTNPISLSAGEATTIFWASAFSTQGEKIITAKVDPQNNIIESNELNNERSLTIQIT